MTRNDTRNYARSMVAPLIAILSLLITAVVLGQVTGKARLSGKGNAVLTSPGAAAPVQTARASIPWTDGARRFPIGGSQAKRHRPVQMDSNTPLFLPAVPHDSGGTTPASVAVGDLNGDHKPDLVVYNENIPNESSVGIFLGNGDGTFQPVVAYDPGGSGAVGPAVAIADLNNDHKPDLATVNGSTGNFGVLLGNGDGTFQPVATNFLCGGGAWTDALAVADVNRDGKLDLLIDNGPCENSVAVLLGNGDGTFDRPYSYYWSGDVGDDSITSADVSGDGKPDVVVANGYHGFSDSVGVLLGNGDGTLQAVTTYYPGGWNPTSVAVSDVNSDGKQDIVVANGGSGGIDTVGILLGNGDGTFQPVVTQDVGVAHPTFVLVADVNGDGHQDLLVADYSINGNQDGAVSVLLGYGDGTFQPVTTYNSGGKGALSIAVGDLNSDGKLDLQVVNSLSNNVGVLLNDGPGTLTSTTTTLTSSLNPSVYGQVATFAASVSSGAGTPTGMVEFFDGTTVLGSTALTNGTASFPDSGLAAGSHPIIAKYQGEGGYRLSISSPLSQIVNTATTATSLASSVNPARVGQSVTYTAIVIGEFGGSATGTVMFQDGGTTIATEAVAGNQAPYSTKYGGPGTHSITATYSGDENATGSTSPTLQENIQKGVATKTVETTSGSPSFVGQPVTFTATVTSSHGAPPDGELVTFYDGTTALASVALAGGTVAFTTSALSAKTHIVKATYLGDATFKPSTGAVTQVVNKYPTTTSLSSSPNPANSGQRVTFTATVTSTGPVATGKVKFLDGATSLGTTKLSGGVAKLSRSTLGVGTHPITAQYLGDAASAKSTSAVVNQVVQ